MAENSIMQNTSMLWDNIILRYVRLELNHHGVTAYVREIMRLSIMVEKMMLEDDKLQVDEVLAHPVSAKNALQNHNGFTPI